MAIVAIDFTHFDLSLKKGDEYNDPEFEALAPHLFVQPDPVPVEDVEPERIRGPLAAPSKSPKKKEA